MPSICTLFSTMEGADSDIKYSNLPETTKYALVVIIKGIQWFPWVFFGVGLILNKENFFYWFMFFLVIEGALVLSLIYILILVVKASLKEQMSEEEKKKEPTKADTIISGYFNQAKSGIVGNIAFYIIVIGGLLVVKFMGIFDSWMVSLKAMLGI